MAYSDLLAALGEIDRGLTRAGGLMRASLSEPLANAFAAAADLEHDVDDLASMLADQVMRCRCGDDLEDL